VLCKLSGYRKKIVVVLALAVLGSGILLLVSARSAANRPGLKKLEVNADSLFGNEPNFYMKTTGSSGNRELFYKMMLSVLLVVGLGVAAVYVSKKLLPRITNLQGREMSIVETIHLGPRKAVHLLKIGNRRFLIGSTNENITKLADVSEGIAQSEDFLSELSSQEINNSRI